jgi:hypothetical protein
VRRHSKTLVIVSILLLIGMFFAYYFTLGRICNCRTNFRHLCWKWLKVPYDETMIFPMLCQDGTFWQSLIGKTREEIQGWFPRMKKLKPVGSIGDDAWSVEGYTDDQSQCGHYIEFRDGRAFRYGVLKG